MSKAFAVPLAATFGDGYAADAALAWLSKRADQSMLWFRFEPPLMQQQNHEGDSDIINKVVRAAGVSFQHHNKDEGKRCHEQNMIGEGLGKVKEPWKEPYDAEKAVDEAVEKEDIKVCKDMFDDRSQEIFEEKVRKRMNKMIKDDDVYEKEKTRKGKGKGNGCRERDKGKRLRINAESPHQPAHIAAPTWRILRVKASPVAESRKFYKSWMKGFSNQTSWTTT